MSLLRPGEHFEGLSIVGNSLYDRARMPHPLSLEARFFNRVVQAAERLDRDGIAVTGRTVHEFNRDLPEAQVAALLSTPRFALAMEEAGVSLSKHPGLSAEQMAAIALYMDMTVPMTHAQKLKMAGVTETKWRGWMRQTEFAERMKEFSADVLRDSMPVAKQRLAQLIDAGNLGAITLGLEMEGVHDRRKDTVDVNALLMGIFAILDEEVGDVEVLKRIANKIRVGMMGQAPILTVSQPLSNQPLSNQIEE